MMTGPNELECDFLGDLAADTHGIWEVFEFVRLHNPNADDEQVFHIGRDLLSNWAHQGWISISESPLYPSTISNVASALQELDQLGPIATRYFTNAPSIDLTAKAREDQPWLTRAG